MRAQVQEEKRQRMDPFEEEENGAQFDVFHVNIGNDNKFRWIYALDMKENPHLFRFIMKLMAGILGFVALLIIVSLYAATGEVQAVFEVMGIFVPIAVLVMGISWLCYRLVAKMYGNQYLMVYEMGEEGIRFAQTDDQAKTTRMIAEASALVGALTHNGALAASGAAQSTENYTKFSGVRTVVLEPSACFIGLNSWFNYNMVYTEESDYDFVVNYILERCPKASVRER